MSATKQAVEKHNQESKGKVSRRTTIPQDEASFRITGSMLKGNEKNKMLLAALGFVIEQTLKATGQYL